MAAKKKKIKNKPFKDWWHEDVAKEFGLTKIRSHSFFEEIDKQELPLDYPHRSLLNDFKEILIDYIESWNEDELKTMFINPFVRLAKFTSPHYKVFTQRLMSVKYANDTLTTEGKVEFMLAKGLQRPQKPHFFIHEYKPEKRHDPDPCGQLLIAMVASQKLNGDDKPLYGLYVIGRLWFFVVLDGNTYSVSKSYSTEDEEIFKIFAILLYIKEIMEKLYQEI